jgi:protein-tyrosine-phosphatase
MAERGIDLADHRSRLVTPGLLDGSNLIIGMARRHVREAHTVQRGVLPRTYTLKELVRRGAEFGSAGRDLEGWLGPIDQERDPADLLGDDEIDDVADPMGRPLRVFRSCANEIEANIIALADLLWPRDGP